MAVIMTRPDQRRRGGHRTRRGRPVNPAAKVERAYARQLTNLSQTINQRMMALAIGLERGDLTKADALGRIEALRSQGLNIEQAAEMADAFVKQANAETTERFERMIKRSLSIDVFKVLDDHGLLNAVEKATKANVQLITSIPLEQLDLVEEAINANFRGESLKGGTLTGEIDRIGGIGKNRARLIARDQTANLNSTINRARQEAAGIRAYIWKTSRDQRVVGNPAGLYPEGNSKHGDHFDREGQRFFWSSPPHDGHPGEAINCRCVAVPIINPEAIASTNAGVV